LLQSFSFFSIEKRKLINSISSVPESFNMTLTKLEHFISNTNTSTNRGFSTSLAGIQYITELPINLARFFNALSALFTDILLLANQSNVETYVSMIKSGKIAIRCTGNAIEEIIVVIDNKYFKYERTTDVFVLFHSTMINTTNHPFNDMYNISNFVAILSESNVRDRLQSQISTGFNSKRTFKPKSNKGLESTGDPTLEGEV
jgi:hypothetical protein